jgi:hypothetical protein
MHKTKNIGAGRYVVPIVLAVVLAMGFGLFCKAALAAVPMITGVQGYNATTQVYSTNIYPSNYLIIYGTNFPTSGNVVSIEGISYTPSYQASAQINVLLDSRVTSGSAPVYVLTSGGQQSNTMTGIVAGATTSAPILTGVQGYNAATGAYTVNTALAGTELILYGTFGSSGNNVVSIISNPDSAYNSKSSGERIISQSASEIAISLADVTPGSYEVVVSGPSGTTAALPFTVTAASTTVIAINPSTLIGPYFWAGSVNGVANSSIMAKGDTLADALGAKVIRIFMSPRSDTDYQGGSCIPNFTLANLAKRSDFNKILSDPQFTTVIITAYDGVSFGDCQTKSYLDQNFYTPANTQKIEQEYTDLANYLKQFNKTFIIDNWEGDNDAYCSEAYAVATGNATCPGAPNALAGLQKWFQARYVGIHASGAGNVFAAIEFNIVRALMNAHLPSVLYNVIPNVSADYYSYSSYESINVSSTRFGADIDTIRAATNNAPLIIGEIGFKVGDFGDAAATAGRLGQMLGVVQEKNVPYAIVWNLLDSPPGMGIYDSSGNITASGQTVKNLIGNSPAPGPSVAVAKVQGYDPATGAYTNGTVIPGTYLILYGNFGASGNTVAINGTILPASAVTYQGPAGVPTATAPNQINISLSALSEVQLNAESSNTVTVTTSDGKLTAQGSFALAPVPSTATSTSTIDATTNVSDVTFPANILVTTASLNVRSAPNTSVPLAGSRVLYADDTFTATNEVVGETVDGNDLWWVSSAGNYVWSGGTMVLSS